MERLKKIAGAGLVPVILVLLTALCVAACSNPSGSEEFVAVTGITGIPANGTAGAPIILSGTVEPSDATNRTIVWTVKDAGTTGASLSGNSLSSVGVGTVVVTATIADGAAEGSAFTQDFGISILTTQAQYREMVLATPDAGNPVTITGDNVYGSGVFPADRTVILSPFKIARYETTYELWHEVKAWATDDARGTNKYTFANAGMEGNDGPAGAAPTSAAKTEPVTSINWRDAIVWCNAYSEMIGKGPVYKNSETVIRDSTNETACDGAQMDTSANGYRLPTEAQWEYAARGGGTPNTAGSFAYTYAGSNTVGDVAWYYDNASTTHSVGEKTANGLGLYDMSGNVFEWCWDWHSSQVGTGSETDPSGLAWGERRLSRGGGWSLGASLCMVSDRNSSYPSVKYIALGFRVVCP
jgi:formylglycine-generating enzyme required for sulfatase activity